MLINLQIYQISLNKLNKILRPRESLFLVNLNKRQWINSSQIIDQNLHCLHRYPWIGLAPDRAVDHPRTGNGERPRCCPRQGTVFQYHGYRRWKLHVDEVTSRCENLQARHSFSIPEDRTSRPLRGRRKRVALPHSEPWRILGAFRWADYL